MTEATAASSNGDSSSSSSSTKRATVKSEHCADAAAVKTETTAPRHRASAKQLKLQLFQELSHRRRREIPHAWSQYWRALQQFLLARVAVDEFQCLLELLLGDDRDLVALHNAFIVAVLAQAQSSSEAPGVAHATTSSSSSKAVDAVETVTTSSSGSTATAHTERSKTSKRARSNSASARDDARAGKKLLHFAHATKRSPRASDAPSSSSSTETQDAQSAELLIRLGASGSRASRDDTAQTSAKTH